MYPTATNKIDFPIQTISETKKTEEWYKKCITDATKLVGTDGSNYVRFSRQEKDILYKLGLDEVDPRDMAKTFNPLQIKDLQESFKQVKNVPFEQGIFKLLRGERDQRPFNYQVKRLNPEAISEVQENKRQILSNFLAEKIKAEAVDEAALKEEIEDLMDKISSYRDIKAIKTKKLLDKLERDNNLETIFSKTFEAKLYVGEEVAFFDFVNGSLKVQHVNESNLFTVNTGTTNKFQDCDILVYVDYLNTSQIISYYRNYLTNAQIKKLQKPVDGDSESIYEDFYPAAPTIYTENSLTYIDVTGSSDDNILGDYMNDSGDYRVARVFWKGKKELKIVDIIDSEGNVFKEVFPSSYEVREDLGEVLDRKIYVDCWEEGTMIGNDIFVKMQEYEGNVYSKQDLSLRAHPFIGYIETLNGKKAVSLMNTIKNLKYLYNVIRYEYEIAIGRNMGNVIEMDMAYLPNKEGWDFEKVIYYMKAAGLKFVDSLNKTEEGKYLSNNTTGKQLNLSQTDHIQTLSIILDQIKSEVYEITGVTPQRLGQVSNRETKGGIERSVQQSSSTTETEFKAHERFKVEVYNNLAELSKVWVNQNKVQLSDFTDDMFQFLSDIDGEEYSESDYGIYISDSYKDIKLKGIIEEMAPTLLQAEVLPFSDYLNIMENDDMNYASMIIKRAERRKERMQQQQQQAVMQAEKESEDKALAQNQLMYEREVAMKQLEFENMELITRLKNQNNLEIKMLDMEVKEGATEANSMIAKNKQDIDRVKESITAAQKSRELDLKAQELKIKEKQINSKPKK